VSEALGRAATAADHAPSRHAEGCRCLEIAATPVAQEALQQPPTFTRGWLPLMILEVQAAGATPQERPSALTGEQQHNPRKEVRKG